MTPSESETDAEMEIQVDETIFDDIPEFMDAFSDDADEEI